MLESQAKIRRRTWQEISPSTLRPIINNNKTGARSSFLPQQLALPELATGRPNTKCNSSGKEILLMALFLICTPALLYLLSTTFVKSRWDDNPLPILIPYLIPPDSQTGGWFVGSQLQYLPDIIREPNDGLADYGGLVFLSLHDNNLEFRRTIRNNDLQLYTNDNTPMSYSWIAWICGYCGYCGFCGYGIELPLIGTKNNELILDSLDFVDILDILDIVLNSP